MRRGARDAQFSAANALSVAVVAALLIGSAVPAAGALAIAVGAPSVDAGLVADPGPAAPGEVGTDGSAQRPVQTPDLLDLLLRPDLAPIAEADELPTLPTIPLPDWSRAARSGDVSGTVPTADPEPAPAGCLPHPPIRITQDAGPQGFVLVPGTQTYRPGSGVVDGSGTAEDPYVIAGWCIDGEFWDAFLPPFLFPDGIRIQGTTAHVVVRDVWVARHDLHGIRVEDARHVAVENTSALANGDTGVDIAGSDDVRLTGLDITDNGRSGVTIRDSNKTRVERSHIARHGLDGVFVTGSSGTWVNDTHLHRNERYGVQVNGSSQFHLTDSQVEDNGIVGVLVEDSDGSVLTGNSLARNDWGGIDLSRTPGARIEDNRVTDHPVVGVNLWASSLARLEDNVLLGNRRPVNIQEGSDGLRMAGNRIAEAEVAVFIAGAGDAHITDNLIHDIWSGVNLQDGADDAWVAGNTITDGQIAIFATRSTEAMILNNTLLRHRRGVNLQDGAHDARLVRNVVTDAEIGLFTASVAATLIVDNTIVRTERGINAQDASGAVRIYRNTVDRAAVGLLLSGPHGAEVVDNSFTRTTDGVFISRTSQAEVTDNLLELTSTDSEFPGRLHLSFSTENRLRRNIIGDGGILLTGSSVDHYLHDIDASNLVNGQPVRYVRQQDGVTVTEPAGQVVIADSSNVTVDGVDLADAFVGVHAAFSDNVTVRHARLTGHLAAVFLEESTDAHLHNNTITDNGNGIFVGAYSHRPTIEDNVVADHPGLGITVFLSGDATVRHNNIDGNDIAGLAAAYAGHPLEATDNWWGHPSGPSGGVEDACTGTVASGTGDAIFVFSADVCFDPWLAAPNPDAGAP